MSLVHEELGAVVEHAARVGREVLHARDVRLYVERSSAFGNALTW